MMGGEKMQFGDIKDVADLLRIKPDTAYKWSRGGYLPTMHLGPGKSRRLLLFDMDEIRDWARGHASGQAGPDEG